jgi:hypothetical protein
MSKVEGYQLNIKVNRDNKKKSYWKPMLDKDKVPKEVNVQKDLRNQMSNDIKNIELFVKKSKILS